MVFCALHCMDTWNVFVLEEDMYMRARGAREKSRLGFFAVMGRREA